ncbi:hypothetical protein L7F22_016423 [Adiantum nelumboides]|nr:hypothetical protein [Adiantum nelumboides]
MAGSSEKKDYYIKKFDGTNFTIWKQRMMDVLVNKGLATPLKERKEGVYKDDQWEELDARARATICLHLGKSIFFTVMDKTTAFELWDSLCSAWDGKSAFNKVFLMKKLMRLSMKEGSSVSSHLKEFNSLYSQQTSKGLNFDDEMKAIFLLCSLLASWDTFNTAISNSTHGGKLTFNDERRSRSTQLSKVLVSLKMRSSQQQDGRHPMQPLCPKKQPWVMSQAPSRPGAMAHSPKHPISVSRPPPSVEEEILLRQRIEERAAQKLEKRHDAVSLDRQARRLQRQKSSEDIGKKVKALQEREFKRSSSLGSSP